MRHAAVVPVVDADIHAGVGQDDESFLGGAVDDAQHTDVVQVNVLVGRVQLDAGDMILF